MKLAAQVLASLTVIAAGVGITGFGTQPHALFGELDQHKVAAVDLFKSLLHQLARGELVFPPLLQVASDADHTMAACLQGATDRFDALPVTETLDGLDRKKDPQCAIPISKING